MEAKGKSILVYSVSATLILVVVFSFFQGNRLKSLSIPGLINLDFSGSEPGLVDDRGSTVSGERSDSDHRPAGESTSGNDVTPLENSSTAGASDSRSSIHNPPVPVNNQGGGVLYDEQYSDDESPSDSFMNLTGNWYGEDGSEYEISQYGNTVSFVEYNLMGMSASGNGYIENRELILEYQTIFGTVGEAHLTATENGSVLRGQAHDLTSGASVQLVLRRY